MAHATNLAKGSPSLPHMTPSQCPFCAAPETQQHINAFCSHSSLVEARLTHRKRIDEYLQCYRHQHLHAKARWIIPIIDYMEDHMWTDTEAGNDIWNGRWDPDLLSRLLGAAAQDVIDHRLLKRTLQRIQTLTHLLEKAQRHLYRVRYIELSSKEAKLRRDTTIALRRKRATKFPRILFAA
jgi:hypothetical protein